MKQLSALLVCITLCPALFAHPQSGSVCVAPSPGSLPERTVLESVYDPATLMFRMDKQPPIRWPRNACVKIGELDLKAHHLITIMSDGKPYQSFRFRFSNYKSTQLCLLFDGIGPPELKDDTRYTPWCKCKEQEGMIGRPPR